MLRKRVEDSKRCKLGSALMQGGRNLDVQESRFHGCETIRYGLCRPAKLVDLLIHRNSDFTL